MIDFHTHFLPGIDDGAKELSDSLEMLGVMKSSGITTVVATPHYYGDRLSPDEFADLRDKKIAEVANADRSGIEIIPAAEVLLDRLLLNQSKESLKRLCYGGGNTILLELPQINGNFEEYADIVFSLMSYFNLNVVIAHVERYAYFLKNPDSVAYLKEVGCTVQLDADCFFGSFGVRRFALKLIKNGLADVIASDCHNLSSRRPNLAEAYGYVAKKLGDGVAEKLKKNAESVLNKAKN